MEEDLDWVEKIEEKVEEFPATEVMMDEHRVIERALSVLKKAVDERIEDEELYLSLAEFFSKYTGEIHHGKEEEIVFKVLKEKAPKHIIDMINALEEDHRVGAELVGKIRENAANFEKLRDFALAYYSMLRDHIVKEDQGLFPAMHPYLSVEEEEKLLKEFERIDKEKEKYEKLVAELEEKV
ncbi:Hemerythrin HHE cation binding domain protein [Ferroglobus placidus DSM 10642]|uniref:Hemerythrin HHE cation binding domain protein n=1 Tax=Ferroglobus placidus (strain DSM 10642 / AEDII12DO) TaxID=589924 RepID=D3RWJ6_FERPA|nr:hemerythrin domain-containing protein [Ferroglobus placidus]ADC64859.1 Hemerythrin HHE cation binding domain protein [Ferroglobus placidus DSM 10642]